MPAVFADGSRQDQGVSIEPAAAQVSPPVPLLWKVSDADNAIYLLGSFHLLKPDDYPLSGDVDAAFADAGQLMFELPPEEMNSPLLATMMMQAALLTNGTSLDSQLPPATAGKLRRWLDANSGQLQGLSPERLQMFEPWFVGLMVSMTEMSKLGLEPALGLDQHFIVAATDAGKPTAGFETAAEQIAFLDGMDKDEQVQFLDEALSEAEGGEGELDRLHDAWRRGDVDMIRDEMALEMKQDYPRLYQHINVERNDHWVPRLRQLLDSEGAGNALVVVGALHLIGDDGVVEKLRLQGYTVERICSACASPPARNSTH